MQLLWGKDASVVDLQEASVWVHDLLAMTVDQQVLADMTEWLDFCPEFSAGALGAHH